MDRCLVRADTVHNRRDTERSSSAIDCTLQSALGSMIVHMLVVAAAAVLAVVAVVAADTKVVVVVEVVDFVDSKVLVVHKFVVVVVVAMNYTNNIKYRC